MAHHRHKRDADARRAFRLPKAPYLAGGLAVLATLSTVGVGMLTAQTDSRDVLLANSPADLSSVVGAPEADAAASDLSVRPQVISRSQGRITREAPWEDMLEKDAVATAVRQADAEQWTTAALNLWETPAEDADKRGVLDDAKKVLVTGRQAAGRVEVVVDGEARWVTSGYLTDENPKSSDGATASLGGACTNGSSVDGQPNVIAVHQAVCAAFPEITSYGTYRSDGEHSQGLAIDIMVSGSRGQEVADFVRAHYAELGVSYVMYAQQIWSVDRSGEGWRYVEDRGSATANHYDHVHVTTY